MIVSAGALPRVSYGIHVQLMTHDRVRTPSSAPSGWTRHDVGTGIMRTVIVSAMMQNRPLLELQTSPHT